MARKATTPGGRRRVFVVDDEPTVRAGLELLLSTQPDFEVCGHSRSEGALAIISSADPGIVVLQYSAYDERALGLIRQLRQHFPALRILVFSLHTQATVARLVLRAGANGYVTREDGTEQILAALRIVGLGHRYLTPTVAARSAGTRRQARSAI